MNFPLLLSVLLHQDCYTEAIAEEPRLLALARANGTNTTLQLYLQYINKTKQSPAPDHLRSLANSTPKCGADLIESDLEEAAQYINAYPAGSFRLALEEAWSEANRHYMKYGYVIANSLATGIIPKELGTYKFEKRLKELYGEDESNWDKPAFSQVWLNEYLDANPFCKQETEDEDDPANEHEKVGASGVYVDDDGEVIHAEFTVINGLDIETKPLKWLWPERIPQGKICWYTGKPKTGKSLALLDLIARVTTGTDWPDKAKNFLPPQDVLLCISEDGSGDTVIPRLKAAGADISRVNFFNRIKVNNGSRQLQLNKHTAMLRRYLESNPAISVVILDPLESFAGDVNINSNQEIRPVMDALSAVCRKTGVTLIGIIHDNKRSDVTAIQKIPGGSAVGGVARAAWGFSRDPDNKEDRYMSLVAGSLSKKETGIKYTIGEREVDGVKAPYIVWGEEHDSSADDLLRAERDNAPSKDGAKLIGLAKDFLPVALKEGPRRAPELISEAEALGISVGALYRAKEQSGNVVIIKRGEEFLQQGRLSWWMLAKEDNRMTEEVL